jgi:hypothetical protein
MRVVSTRFLSASACVWMLVLPPLCPGLLGADRTSNATDKQQPTLQARWVQSYGKLPLSFEANQGQADGQVKFLARGRGYSLFLTADEGVLALRGEREQLQVRSQEETPQATPHALFGLGDLPAFLASPLLGFTTQTSGLGNPPADGIPAPSLAPHVVRLKLLGANPDVRVVGLDEQPGISNYFLGNDPTKWHTNVPTFAKVKYQDVYRGVDLVYYGNQQELEYDFVLAAGSDPGVIVLQIETGNLKTGKPAAIRLDANGDLVIATSAGEIRFRKPVVYQLDPNHEGRQPVEGRYRLLADNRVGVKVGSYDHSRPLIIDPVLTYSTYLGGTGIDAGLRIAVDSDKNAYLTGATSSSDFPMASGGHLGAVCSIGSPFYKSYPCPDAFVTKLNSDGSLGYSTYLGGSSGDVGVGISVDSSGNAYVVGSTSSQDFPRTAGVYQSPSSGNGEIFVAKLNSTGALSFSMYFGGSEDDAATSGVADSSGNTYITGVTNSDDFPFTPGALQTTRGGGMCGPSYNPKPCADAFVAKLNATGTDLTYATFLGGDNVDVAAGIAVDSAGNALVTGITLSSDFPTQNAIHASPHGGTCGAGQTAHPCTDAFVSKVNPTGTAPLVYSTYLGGNGDDGGLAVAVDGDRNAYVTGLTNSTTGDFSGSPGGGNCGTTSTPVTCPDAFATKLSASGALGYSTYLGGSSYDLGFGVATDSAGNAYFTGGTGSLDFPTQDAFQSSFGGGDCSFEASGIVFAVSCPNAFLTKLDSAGAVSFSTYHGGAGGDIGFGVAVDTANAVYVVGTTVSSDFPTESPSQAHLAGDSDAFVAKISPTFKIAPSSDSSNSATVSAGQSHDYKLTLAPEGFTGHVNFTCTGAPAEATCTPDPTSVDLDGSTPAEVTVTVTTTAPSAAAPLLHPPAGKVPRPLLLFFVVLILMGISLAVAPARRRPAWLLAGTMLLMLTWASCGGGGSKPPPPSPQGGTPKGTYTLTVTATSGSFSQSMDLTLTVN